MASVRVSMENINMALESLLDFQEDWMHFHSEVEESAKELKSLIQLVEEFIDDWGPEDEDEE